MEYTFDTLYPERRCYPGFEHSPGHILAAQELANWMKSKKSLFGNVKMYKGVTKRDFNKRKGVVFIKNGWPPERAFRVTKQPFVINVQ